MRRSYIASTPPSEPEVNGFGDGAYVTQGNTDSERVTRCRICGSFELSPSFRVAFPHFGPNLSYVWPVDVEPPVPFWTVEECGDCGIRFPNPLLSVDDLYCYYADQQEPNEWEQVHYVAGTPDKEANWLRFANKLTRLNGGPGRLLEIGPAAGHLLSAARQVGWSTLGVEASPKFAKIVSQKGLAVHQGLLATLDADDHSFDVIVMLDVLEHLHDPIADLRRCLRLLKPDGRIVIATCDIGSFAARYYALKWRQLVISHTFYWTKESIQIALQKAGFEPIQLSSIRWWDPESTLERRQRVEEFAKLIVRKGIHLTWTPIARNLRFARRFQETVRGGKFDYWLTNKIGDQAVMSDIVLVVARPNPELAALV